VIASYTFGAAGRSFNLVVLRRLIKKIHCFSCVVPFLINILTASGVFYTFCVGLGNCAKYDIRSPAIATYPSEAAGRSFNLVVLRRLIEKFIVLMRGAVRNKYFDCIRCL
jgi:hypothetical protein